MTASLTILDPDSIVALARVSDARASEIWRRALARDADENAAPLVSLLADWSEFAGIGYPEMLREVFSAQERIDSDWREQRPQGPGPVAAFYDATRTMIPLLVWWHGTDLNPARCAAGAREVMCAVGARRALDFGCGIGSTALVVAGAGIEVALADVSHELLDFAAGRARERGHAPETLDLLSETKLGALASASVHAITAFDVLEHIPDPTPALLELDRALAPGGVICLNQAYVPRDDELQHYPQHGEVLRFLHRSGYRLAHVRHVCWVAQKAPLSTLRHRRQGFALAARIAATRAVEGHDGPLSRRLAHHVIGRALR